MRNEFTRCFILELNKGSLHFSYSVDYEHLIVGCWT